jgi:hypothetical protein
MQTYQTGEYHPTYGFYCNRDFYIVSKRDGRYLSSVSRQVLIKTRVNTQGQKWQFNCNAEAIVSQEASRNQILEIVSNGNSRNMVTYPRGLGSKYNKWWADFAYKNEELVNLKNGKLIDATSSSTEGVKVIVDNRRNTVQ